uniref:PPUP9367 n=1 Tax=Poeciliopsis prolifica TaxID=188132 RepID=A0A0S7EJ27_9TELE
MPAYQHPMTNNENNKVTNCRRRLPAKMCMIIRKACSLCSLVTGNLLEADEKSEATWKVEEMIKHSKRDLSAVFSSLQSDRRRPPARLVTIEPRRHTINK